MNIDHLREVIRLQEIEIRDLTAERDSFRHSLELTEQLRMEWEARAALPTVEAVAFADPKLLAGIKELDDGMIVYSEPIFSYTVPLVPAARLTALTAEKTQMVADCQQELREAYAEYVERAEAAERERDELLARQDRHEKAMDIIERAAERLKLI